MDILHFIILALATWRVASLFTNPDEDGPFRVFDWIRYGVGIRYDARGEIDEDINEVAKAFACIWCFSIYVAIGWTVFYWYAPLWAFWIGLPFALSAVAIMMDEYANP